MCLWAAFSWSLHIGLHGCGSLEQCVLGSEAMVEADLIAFEADQSELAASQLPQMLVESLGPLVRWSSIVSPS